MNGTHEQAFRAAVLAALGHAPALIDAGRLHRFATTDRPGDSAGWCKLFADRRGGVYGCHRAAVSETWIADGRTSLSSAQRADLAREIATATAERQAEQRQQWARNAERIRAMWSQCLPLSPSDPAALYLLRRGFGGDWPMPTTLRLHPALPYWHGTAKLGLFPALVAPMVAADGRMLALHRTYLTPDGCKAAVPCPKKLTGAGGPLSGACIPLHRPARGTIGIAEGIETALAACCASGVPTVASYCAGNLAAWQWPLSVRRLVVFADADKAGREAADTLRTRAQLAGLRVEVLAPTEPDTVWCDVWAGRDAALIEARGST